MLKRILLITTLILTFQVSSYGQIYIEIFTESKTKDFNEIVTKVESYYQNKDKGRGSGYKQFKRWEHYHSTRLSSDGKIVDVTSKNFDEFYFYQENIDSKTSGRTANNVNVVAGEWETVGPTQYSRIVSGHNGGIGRVNTIEIDPGYSHRIYIGTPGGGLWRSTNSGSTWTPLTDGIPRIGVSGIAIDYNTPSNNRTIYILTGDGDGGTTPSIGVLKSMDNGKTWYSTGLTGADLTRPYKLRIHPTNSNILYAVDWRGVFKTTDGGLTWTNTTNSLGVVQFYDIEFKPGDPTRMYASTDDHTYISNNSGDTWFQSALYPPSNTTRIELAVTPAKSNYVYAVCGGNWNSTPLPQIGFNGVYRSEDSGLSFFRQSNEPNILGYNTNGGDDGDQSWYDLAIAVSPTNANEVHVGGINTWKSVDGGFNWSNTSNWLEPSAGGGNYTHADIHTLKFTTSNTIYCGSDGGIYKSVDRASNWSSISNGLQISQVYRLGLGTESNNVKSPLYFGSQDNGLNAIKTNSTTALHWEGADGLEVHVLPNNRYVLGATQRGKLKRMFNESGLNDVTPSGEEGAWLTPFTTHDDGSNFPKNTVYVGYQDVFYQSTPYSIGPAGGGHWTNISNGALGSGNCTHIAVAPSNKNYVYVSKGSRLFRTTNLGSSWTNISAGLSTSSKNYFVVHPTNPNIVYVVTGNFSAGQKVYRTTNGGISWTNISGSLPNVPINCIVYEENSANGIYVGMDVGVFYRDNNLSDWTPFYHQLPNVEITELEIDYSTNEIYASTYGRGIWKSSLYGKSCKSNVTVSHDLDGFKLFSANNLTSTSAVEPFADVNFVAANSITLSPGFHSVAESEFNARIDSDVCSDGISNRGESTEKTGIYAGPLPGVVGLKSEQSDTDPANSLYIFPNPASSDIYLQLDLQADRNLSFYLYDLKGKLILKEDKGMKNSGKVVEKFNVSSIPSGIYILKITSGNSSTSSKVVIEH